ncbi:MAG: DNA gyrase inhibitor YacG [Planctomycetes bacterium]|nr:DNA gyrase inhibitor YacG [Planctomycetota bacterium]
MAQTLPCPQCKRPVGLAGTSRPATFPFCSGRCRTLDLGAWADGRHVIAGKTLFPEPDDGDDADR